MRYYENTIITVPSNIEIQLGISEITIATIYVYTSTKKRANKLLDQFLEYCPKPSGSISLLAH